MSKIIKFDFDLLTNSIKNNQPFSLKIKNLEYLLDCCRLITLERLKLKKEWFYLDVLDINNSIFKLKFNKNESDIIYHDNEERLLYVLCLIVDRIFIDQTIRDIKRLSSVKFSLKELEDNLKEIRKEITVHLDFLELSNFSFKFNDDNSTYYQQN